MGALLCRLKLRDRGKLPCSPASFYRMSSLQTSSGCLLFLEQGRTTTLPRMPDASQMPSWQQLEPADAYRKNGKQSSSRTGPTIVGSMPEALPATRMCLPRLSDLGDLPYSVVPLARA